MAIDGQWPLEIYWIQAANFGKDFNLRIVLLYVYIHNKHSFRLEDLWFARTKKARPKRC